MSQTRSNHAVEGQLEIGVLPDDDGVLATELEADALQRLRRAAAYIHARLGMAREGDDPHVWVIDQRVAHIGP